MGSRSLSQIAIVEQAEDTRNTIQFVHKVIQDPVP